MIGPIDRLRGARCGKVHTGTLEWHTRSEAATTHRLEPINRSPQGDAVTSVAPLTGAALPHPLDGAKASPFDGHHILAMGNTSPHEFGQSVD